MRRPWLAILMVTCLAAPMACQAPPAAIEVALKFCAPGTKLARDPDRAESASERREPFRLVGRVLHWETGRRPFHDPALLCQELSRQAAGIGPGDGTAIPTRIRVGRDICWADLSLTLALVRDARLGGTPSVEMASSSARPVPAGGADAGLLTWEMVRVEAGEVPADLVVPAVADVAPRAKLAWQPEVDILQDGGVRYAGKVVHDPGQHGADRSGVLTLLQQLLAEAKRHGQVRHDLVDGKVQELPTVEILLRADKWTGVDHVQEFLRDCVRSRVGFPKVLLAVTEQDGERKPGTGK